MIDSITGINFAIRSSTNRSDCKSMCQKLSVGIYITKTMVETTLDGYKYSAVTVWWYLEGHQ